MGGEIGSLRPGPARRRGDLGRRSARARDAASRRSGSTASGSRSRTARPGCATATATPTEGELPKAYEQVIALVSLALATLAFVGTHLALSHPLRARLVAQSRRARLPLLYSLVAFVTLGWMILAWRAASEQLPAVGRAALVVAGRLGVMLLASILLVGSLFRNPAFPRPGAKPQARSRPATGVFAITRHPMNWSFILWALVHISLWGSPRNLIVAGGILVLALVGSIGQDRKKLDVVGEPGGHWMARTSFVPVRGAADRPGEVAGRCAEAWPALLLGLAALARHHLVPRAGSLADRGADR